MRSGRGAFIALEGGDGSGKTGALAHLVTVLAGAAGGVVATREPGGTPEGQAIRGLLLTPPRLELGAARTRSRTTGSRRPNSC